MFELNEKPILAKLAYVPKNRQNPVDWLKKNFVSTNGMSFEYARKKFIENLDQ